MVGGGGRCRERGRDAPFLIHVDTRYSSSNIAADPASRGLKREARPFTLHSTPSRACSRSRTAPFHVSM